MSSAQGRARHKLQPLSIEDAVAAPGLSGLSEVLRTMVAPAAETVTTKTELLPPGDTKSSGDIKTPDVTESPDDISAPGDIKSSEQTHKFEYAIRPWRMAQHGMSTTEHAVYLCLFNSGVDVDSLPEVRQCSLSMARIGQHTGLPDRTCQRAVQRLRLKRVIEIAQPAQCEAAKPPIYRVKNYGAIMGAWKALGLTHVTGGRSRILTDPNRRERRLGGGFDLQDSEPSATDNYGNVRIGEADTMSSGDINSPGDAVSPDDFKTGDPGDSRSEGPGDAKSPLKEIKELRIVSRNSTATAASAVSIAAVAAALQRYGPADELAAKQLVQSCQERCPDCQTSDIVTAIHWKGSTLQRQRGVQNAIAILMASCASLVAAACRERLVAEAKRAEEQAQQEIAKKRADLLAEIRQFPADNPWSRILDWLKGHVSTHSYGCFLQPSLYAGTDEHTLRVCVPNEKFKFIEQKYATEISQAIHELGLDSNGIQCLTIDELLHEYVEQSYER